MNKQKIEEQKENILKEATKIIKPKISSAEKSKIYKNQINLLNDIVKIKLAPSKIHGVGVIALEDIKKGDKLYTDIIPHQFDLPFKMFSFLKKTVREQIIGEYPLVIEGSHFLYPSGKISAYLNHSNNPNYDAKKDEALRDIKAGEEITEDYRLITPKYKKIYTWLE